MFTQHQLDAIESIGILEVDSDLNLTNSSLREAVDIFTIFLNNSEFNVPGVIYSGSFENYGVYVNAITTDYFSVELMLYRNYVIEIQGYDDDIGSIEGWEIGTLTDLIVMPNILLENILKFIDHHENLLCNYECQENAEER